MGRDEGNKVISFNYDKDVVGEFLQIKIVKAQGISIYGEVVDGSFTNDGTISNYQRKI